MKELLFLILKRKDGIYLKKKRFFQSIIIILIFLFIGHPGYAQPSISSNGGGVNANINLPENTSAVTTVTATSIETITYSISEGVDSALFSIDAVTGVLTFDMIPDFEKPIDAVANNTYIVQVTATDINGSDNQTITVTISNVDEAPDPPINLYIHALDQANELHWTQSAAGGVLEYRIYRSTDSIVFTPLATVPDPQTTYIDNALINGKFYFYRVTAWDGATESVVSNTDASTPEKNISTYLAFDGAGDYVELFDNERINLSFGQAFSIECWVWLNDLSGRQIILSRDNNTSSTVFYQLYFNSGVFGARVNTSQSILETNTGSLTTEAKKWYHLAFTMDPGATGASTDNTMYLFVNGQQQVSKGPGVGTTLGPFESTSSSSYTLSRLVVGAKTDTRNPFTYEDYLDGRISEVRIWDRYVDQAEIQANMNSRRKGDEAGIFGLWHFDRIYNNQLYEYTAKNENASAFGDVSVFATKIIAEDDFFSVTANSSDNILDVRDNDTIQTGSNDILVPSKLTKLPNNGTATIHQDTIINYSPDAGFTGLDTIAYLVVDTTFLSDPFLLADTASIVINVRCDNRSEFDWNSLNNGTEPNGETYTEEGLFTKFDLSDPNTIANSFNVDNRFQATKSLVWQQSPNTTAEVSTLTMDFNETVDQLCFNVLNIDSSANNKDSLIIDAYFNGNKTVLVNEELVLSSSLQFKGNNTFVGTSNVTNPSLDGNLEVCLLSPVDSLLITYGNPASGGNNQSIGIGNFNWCEITNDAPQFIDDSNINISTIPDTTNEDSDLLILLKLLDANFDSLTISSAIAQSGSVIGIPSLDSSFTYSPTSEFNGKDTIAVIVEDNRLPALKDTLSIFLEIRAVNDAPSFTKGPNESLLENAGAQTINSWATSISAGPGDESTQTLSFTVTNDNNDLFTSQPSIDANGNLTYTPASDSSGIANVTVILRDNGGIANGGVDSSATQSFTITIGSINDAPSFTKGPDENILENAGAQTVNSWATSISAGPADESTQTLSFTVTNDNNGLFTSQPSIDANGNLTYTPASDLSGIANVTVILRDNGGIANGGVDSSATQSFTITIGSINDAPSFTKGPDETILENAGAQTVNGWATSISAGPGDESTQTLSFTVTNDNNDLFAIQPSIDANGNLTYTPASDSSGIVNVTVILRDNGGTADGGVDSSATQSFMITIGSINDAPSFTKGPNETILENAGAQTVNSWATSISAGPADESAQTLIFTVTNDNNGLFASQPSIDANGNLTYTPASDSSGTANVTVILRDNGGTANGGVDSSATQSFTITMGSINDAPSFTKGMDIMVNEDEEMQVIGSWATSISSGPVDEIGQTLSFTAINDNNTLFGIQPSVDANGTLMFTPANDANGVANVTVMLRDNGGTANGGVDSSATQNFTITVQSINDAPSFIKGQDILINENTSGLQTINAWATALSPGPGDEIGQSLTFSVSNNNTALFMTQPAVDSNGNLTFTPNQNMLGNAIVTVVLKDDGGVLNGGIDETIGLTFNIAIVEVQNAPTDILLSNTSIDENRSPGTGIGSLRSIDIDPGDSHTYKLLGPNASLFSINGDSLFTDRSFDFESNTSLSISIETEDASGRTFKKDFIIVVNDINEHPTDLLLSNASILELLPVGSSIGDLSTDDVDFDDSHTYSIISDEEAQPFIIEGSILKSNTVFDSRVQSTYSLAIVSSDKQGLTIERNFEISIEPNPDSGFIIPTAFTPNGDDENDNWEIRNIELFPNCRVVIIDRNGQEIFQSIGYKKPWNGTFRGKKLPHGTYYFNVTLNDELRRSFNGFVMIL